MTRELREGIVIVEKEKEHHEDTCVNANVIEPFISESRISERERRYELSGEKGYNR